MPKWRNWQTRTFEGRVRQLVGVRVPPSANQLYNLNRLKFFIARLISSRTRTASIVPRQGAKTSDHIAPQDSPAAIGDALLSGQRESGKSIALPRPIDDSLIKGIHVEKTTIQFDRIKSLSDAGLLERRSKAERRGAVWR